MKRKIDVIVVKRLSEELITLELQTIEDDIHTYYKLIGCRSIDIVVRYFNNIPFNIVCDDEGLLVANERNEWPTSWWQREGYTPDHEALCGTLLLCHCDTEGNLTSVLPSELFDLQCCYKTIKRQNGQELAMLFHDIEER